MGAVYSEGTLVRLFGVFKDADGTTIDPEHVFVELRNVKTTAVTTFQYGVDSSVVRSSTGYYHFDVSPAPAKWRYAWFSTGAGQAAAVGNFTVASRGS